MREALDKALKDLAAKPASRDLGGLEQAVWAHIEGQGQTSAGINSGGLRWAAVSLALVVGVASGSAAALSRPQGATEVAVFSVNSPLNPSTLLGDQG